MDFNRQNIFQATSAKTAVWDAGLRAYMLKVYNYMATGVLLTGIISLISFKMSVVTDSTGTIASLVNIFLKSAMMYFVISILGVLIFVGLTAYDTQKIKNMYSASDTVEISGKKAIMGALTLYLDFINLFIMLLRLFGQRR